MSVSATTEGLAVINTTTTPIAVTEWDMGIRPMIVPAGFCAPDCHFQMPGERRVTAWSSIFGFSADRFDYVILWSQATVASNGTVRMGTTHYSYVTR